MNRIPERSSTVRAGFTLIELLVAITVLLILAAMTFTMVNASVKSDQIRSAARQIQSYVEGARDRAIHAGKVNPGTDNAAAHRGVRFLRDPAFLPPNFTDTTDPRYGRIVNAMVFVQSQEPERGVTTIDTTDNQWFPYPSPAGWDELVEKGMLNPSGATITLAQSATSSPFTFVMYRDVWMHPMMGLVPRWRLTRPVTSVISPYTGTPLFAVLYLDPVVMPNQEPRLLPSSIRIDLSNSRHPWGLTENMDVMFSPRGTVSGSISAAGNIHLLLADSRDIERRLGPIDADLNANSTIDENEQHKGDTLVVSITTQTGKVTSHPVSYTANDPFEFAETGQEAK